MKTEIRNKNDEIRNKFKSGKKQIRNGGTQPQLRWGWSPTEPRRTSGFSSFFFLICFLFLISYFLFDISPLRSRAAAGAQRPVPLNPPRLHDRGRAALA